MWVATLPKWRYLRGKWTRGRGILLQMLGEISRKTLPRYQILFIQIYDISIKVLLHLDIKTRIKFFPIITAVLEQSYLKWVCIFFTRLTWNIVIQWNGSAFSTFWLFLELQTPCSKNPCLNEGKCISFKETFKCVCKNGYNGSTCEGALTTAIIHQFNKTKPKIRLSRQHNFFLRFIFKER